MKKQNIKALSIDWNDYQSVNSAFQMLKSRKVELDPNRVPRIEKERNTYNACLDIFLSYNGEKKGSHYVYAHCDPERPLRKSDRFFQFAKRIGLTHMPFYIGKGCGDRCFNFKRNGEHAKARQRINRSGLEIKVNVIVDQIDEKSAFEYESRLIDIFGLQSYGGILVNLDEGKNSLSRKIGYSSAFEKLHKGVLGELTRAQTLAGC